MKPKRIKAEKYDRHIDIGVFSEGHLPSTKWEPCYLLRQSDIRALAEQMAQDFWDRRESIVPSMLYALKRAGITPGRKERAK